VTLVSNRSFGFTAGELGTVNRVGSNNNLILFNYCFGWIKTELQLRHSNEYVDFATNFNSVDYLNLAKGFGINVVRVESPKDLRPELNEAFSLDKPMFTKIIVKPENEIAPRFFLN